MSKLSNWMLLCWHGVSRMVVEKGSPSSERKTQESLKQHQHVQTVEKHFFQRMNNEEDNIYSYF